jgi:hypothetical protein
MERQKQINHVWIDRDSIQVQLTCSLSTQWSVVPMTLWWLKARLAVCKWAVQKFDMERFNPKRRNGEEGKK